MWSSGRAPPTRYQRPMKVASALVSAAFGRVFIISATDRDVLSALPFLLGNNDWSSGTGSGYFLGRVCVSALRYNIDATDDDEGPTGPSAAAHFGQEMWERADPPSSNSEALSMTNASLPLVFDIRRMLPPAGGDRALQTAASALQRTLTGKSGFYEKVLHFRDQLKLSTPVAKTLKHLIGDGKHHKYTREEKLGRIKKLLEHAENVATDKAKMVHDGIKHAATAIRDADEQMLEYAKSVASRIPEATKKRIKEAAHGLSKDLEKLKKATGDTLKGAYEAVHEWEKKLASGYRRAVQSKLSKYLGVLKSTAADKGAHVMSKIVKVTSGAKVAEFFFTLFKKEVSKQLSRVLPDAKAKQALTDIAPHLQTVATTFINDVIAHQLWNGLHESFTHHHDAQVAEGDAHLNDSPDAAAEAGKEEYSADPQDKLQAQAITAVESLVIQMLSDILQVVFLETTWTGISRNVMTFVDDMCVTSLELLIVATSIGVSIPYPVLEKICHIIVEKPFETHVMNAVPKFLMGTTSEGLRMILGKSNTVHTVATAIANVIVDTEKGPPAVTGHLITWHQFLHTDQKTALGQLIEPMRTIFPTHAKSLGQALSTILVGAIKDQVFVVFKIATAELESVPGLSVLLELATPVLHQFSGIIASSLLSYLVTIGGELMLEEVSTEAIAAAQQALAETAESRVAAEQEHSTFLAYLQEKLEKGSNTLFPDSLREELMQALINHCLHKSHELFKPEAKSFLHTGAHGTAGLAMVQLGSADTAAEHVDPHGDADAPRIDDFRRVRFASEKQPTMPLLLLANNMTEPPVSALDLQFSTHDHQKADAGTSHGEKALTVVSWDVVHKMITAFENVGKTISAHVWTELKDSAQHLFENFVGVAVSDAMSEIRAALSAFFRGVASDTLATHLAEHPSGKELAKNKGEHLAAEESIRSAINGCDLTPATESASGTKKAIQKATDGLRSAIETNVIHNTFDNFVKKLLGLLGVGQHTAEGSAGGTHPHQQGLKDLIHTLLESLMGHIETLMGMLHGGHGHKSAAAFLEHNVAGSQSVYVDAFAELSNGREDKKHGRTLPDSVVPGDEFSPAATEPEDLA